MRIIAGEYKGRRINYKIPSNIRPTTDIVRESVFNTLSNLLDFNNINIADIFSGTGMFGFESISRGAKTSFFFDNNFKSISLIKKIALELNVDKDKIIIIKGDALKSINLLNKDYQDIQFDLLFIDPPYKNTDTDELLILLTRNNFIGDNSIIVMEHSSINKIILPKGLKIIKSKIFGETQIDYVIKH